VFGVMGLIALGLIAAVKYHLPETKTEDASVDFSLKAIVKEYLAVGNNRLFLIYALTVGVSYAGMYAYIAGSPFVFMQKFGFSAKAFGWAFAFNACGLILGSQLNRLALKSYSSAAICLRAAVVLLSVGSALLISTLTGFAGSTLTLCFTFLFLCCIGFINPNATALALSPFTAAAGRASALLGSIQMVAGVLASWLVSFLNNGTTVIMPAVMFGCTAITLALLLLPAKRNSG
jgi:DHA1 family bicyclomycin/chloramphenicol resistance-like MFS transporter